MKQIREMLAKGDFAGIEAWAEADGRVLRELNGLLFEEDELLRWRAIAALGRAAGARAKSDLEAVRNLLRRLFFSLNEDSGSVGWHAPEAIGEILAQTPALLPEYASLLGDCLGKPLFARGTHWAVARLVRLRPDLFAEQIPGLRAGLDSPDAFVRGHAGAALRGLKAATEAERQRLSLDTAGVRVYDFASASMRETTVRELAEGAV